MPEVVPPGRPDQLETRWRGIGFVALLVGPVVSGGGLLQIHAQRQQVGGRHSVGQRVVHLVDDGDSPVGQPVDEVHLPQRFTAIQWGAGDFGDRVVELAPPARSGQPQRPDVVFEVHFDVFAPHRVMELPGDVDKLIAQRIQLAQPAADHLTELLDAHTPGQRAEVDDGDARVGRVRLREERPRRVLDPLAIRSACALPMPSVRASSSATSWP